MRDQRRCPTCHTWLPGDDSCCGSGEHHWTEPDTYYDGNDVA